MLDFLQTGVAWAMGGGGGTGGAKRPEASDAGGMGSAAFHWPLAHAHSHVRHFLFSAHSSPAKTGQKAQKEMLANLRKGDNVLTSGGIYGRITGISDNVVVVEIAPQVRVKMNRGNVAGVARCGRGRAGGHRR